MAINVFDAPIPGQSLTQPPKGSRLEQPPKFVDPDEAAAFLFDRFTSKDAAEQLALLLDNGVTVERIARTTLMSGLLEGLYTVDVMLLITEPVFYMIAAIGKKAGVKDIKMKNPNKRREQFLKNFIGKYSEKPAGVSEQAMNIFTGLGE